MDAWRNVVLDEFAEVLDNFRIPVSEELRDKNPGDTPYYGANGLQGYISGWIFDEPLILIAEDGGYFDEYPTRPVAYRIDGKSWVNNHAHILRPKEGFDFNFVFYSLQHKNIMPFIKGGTRAKLNQKELREIEIYVPELRRQQQKIAHILQTIDRAIEKTEALIDKYQQIKAGLMHDLFTRGIGPDGQLRPPREQAPNLYQQTPIGWIPKEWGVEKVCDTVDSLVDGPFGSNLKTEHYVSDPGVRVIRLQNVAEYAYNDNDKAYISENHANYLIRNQVIGDDVLIAGLGEERYPVGRSCVYPADLPPAVNKADCFRARCKPNAAHNKYFMLFLNSEHARKQVRRYEQGVTRPRINTGNIKKILVPLPSLEEQSQIIRKFNAIQKMASVELGNLEKLQKQKSGLMHDLLTGRVQVSPEETMVAQ